MEENVYEVSLGQLFRVALKHWWVIVAAVAIGASVAFAYVSFFVAPQYTTNAKIGVNNTNMSSYQDLIAGQTIAEDGAKILMGNISLGRAADKLNSSSDAAEFNKVYSAENLAAMINTTASEGSRYFEVDVTSTNPHESKVVAQHVIEAFCEILEEEDMLNGAKGSVIHCPVVPKSPSYPNKTLSIALGALIGAVFSFGTLMVVYFVKDELDSEDWLLETYKDNIPILSVIPDASNGRRGYRKYSVGYGYRYKYRRANTPKN